MPDGRVLSIMQVNRHTGGLEKRHIKGAKTLNVNRHTGGLEK